MGVGVFASFSVCARVVGFGLTSAALALALAFCVTLFVVEEWIDLHFSDSDAEPKIPSGEPLPEDFRPVGHALPGEAD